MENTTIFDDVLRTIQERLPKLLIPLVNEVFGTTYSNDTKVNYPMQSEPRTILLSNFHAPVSFICVLRKIL